MNKSLLSTIAATMLPMGLNNASAQPAGAYSYIGSRGKRASYITSSNEQRLFNHAPINLRQEALIDSEIMLSAHTSAPNSDLSKPNTNIQNIAKQDDLALISHIPVNELIIIDAAVPDKHLFYKNLKNNVEIIEINSHQDGLEQLKTILSSYHNLDALHLVSHADDGVIYLGNSRITSQRLKDEITTLSSLDNALKDGADLLLYGCDLAKSQKGEDLLELISSTANIDVAASNDLTGSAQNISDWDLEITIGNIETDQPFSEIALKDFTSTLALKTYGLAEIYTYNYKGGTGNYYNQESLSTSDGNIVFTSPGYNVSTTRDQSSEGTYFNVVVGYNSATYSSYGPTLKVAADGTNTATFELHTLQFSVAADADSSCNANNEHTVALTVEGFNLDDTSAGTQDFSVTTKAAYCTGYSEVDKFDSIDLSTTFGSGKNLKHFIIRYDGTAPTDKNFTLTTLTVDNLRAPSSNAVPTDIALSSASATQSSGTNATVGTLTTSDADAGDSHTYSLVSGFGDTNNGNFSISGNTLTVNNAATLNAGSYSVRINTDDGTDDFSKSFTITVTDDIAPELSSVSIPNSVHKVGDTVTATITVTSDSDDYTTGSGGISGTINGYTLASLSKTNDTTYTATFTVNDGGTDVAAGSDITVNLTLTDSTGNTSSAHTTAINQSDDAIYANLPEVSLTADTNTIAEDGGIATLTATLSGSLNNQWPVDITTNLAYTGTGTAGTDYSKSDSITITAGSSTGTATITGTADTIFDAASDETAIVDISSVSVGTEGTTNQQTITIPDAESAPTVTLATGTDTLAENGGTSTITASLSTATYANVTVNLGYTGTATAGGTDYNTASASITIPAGSTSASAVTGITSVDDADIEGNETIIIDIASVTGGSAVEATTQQKTITITDDEDGTAPTISAVAITDSAHKVGDTVTATITVTSDSDDYTTGSGGISGSINGYTLGSFSKTNDTTYTATFTVNDNGTDVAADSDVAVSLTLTDSAGNTSSTFSTAISQNSDAIYANLPEVSLTADTNTIAEYGGIAILTATISGSLNNQWPSDISVGLAYTGTATINTDYTGAMSMTITAGNATVSNALTGVADTLYDAANAEIIIADISTLSVGTEGTSNQQTISIIDAETAPMVTLTTSSDTLAENGGTGTITATLNHATYEDVIVNLDYSGDATGGSDYATPSNSITIAAGSLTANATTGLTGLDDFTDEDNETIIIDVSSVSGSSATENGTQQQTVTITDDDDAPTIAFNASASNGSESTGSANLQVDLSAASALTVTVDYTVTGTATGDDYTLADGTLTLAAGDTSDNITIADIVDDLLDENNETVIVTLSNPVNATLGSNTAHTYTINDDDDAPTIAFNSTTSNGNESISSANLLVDLSAASALTVTVDYTVTGTATGDDYTLADGTLTLAAGDASNNITIAAIVDDLLDETNETVIVTLSNPVNATLGSNTTHTYTITDDDDAPTIAFNASTSNGLESTSSTDLQVELSAASALTVTVDYTVTGTATGDDYTLADGTLTLAAGDISNNITVAGIVDDLLDENNETVIVTLSNPVNAILGSNTAHTYTINDDDDAPTIAFNASTSNGLESTGSANLQVDLSAASALTVTVDYTVTGTATGDDYTLANGTLTLAAGDTSNNITIAGIVDDLLDENNETVIVTLSNPVNATLGGNTVHTYTINDDDDAPTIAFNSTTSNGNESISSANLLVDLSAASALPVTVDYTVTGTATGDDYTMANGTLTLAAGDTSNNITIAGIVDDLLDENNETVIVTLSNPVNATLGSNTIHTYTINDNDDSPEVSSVAIPNTSSKVGDTVTTTITVSTDGDDYTTGSGGISGTINGYTLSNLTKVSDNQYTATFIVNDGGTDVAAGSDVAVSLTLTDSAGNNSTTYTTSISQSGDAIYANLPEVSLTADANVINEDGGVSTLSASLSGSLNNQWPTDIIVKLAYTGTATINTDYTGANSLTITTGSSSATTAITGVADNLYDAASAETIIVDISGLSIGNKGTISQQTVSITDAESTPTVTLTTSTDTLAENGGTSKVTATLSHATYETVTVNLDYSGDATSGSDYATPSSVITIAAGSLTEDATTDLTGLDDAEGEGDESIIIAVTSVSGGGASESGNQQQTVTITDNEDITPPSVNSITLVGAPEIGDSTITFRILFDEEIQGLSTDDFILTKTDSANATIASVASSSGNNIDIKVSDISGTGSLRLDLVANNNITDGSGNGNNTFGYVAAFSAGDVHNVDRDAPEITSITPAEGAKTNDIEVPFTVIFNDNVDNILSNGFKLSTVSGNATGAVSSVSATSGSSVVVNVTNISGTGSVRLDYSGTNLSDAAGNEVATYSLGTSHSVDLDAPTFDGVDFITDPIRIDNQTSASFKIIAAEFGSTASYSINSSGGGTEVTGSTAILTSEQTVSNIDLRGLKDGIITLTVKLTDIAGNESIEQSDTVNKDATTAVINAVSIPEGIYKAGDTIAISVTFDDSVSVSGNNIRIALDLGGETKQVPLTSHSSNKLIFSYKVQPGDTEPDGLLVEASSISLNGGTILDAGGNDADLSFSLVSNNNALVDTAIPSSPAVDTPTEHIFVNLDEYQIKGSHIEDGVTIKLYQDSNNDGVADNNNIQASTQVISGDWSLTPTLISDSDHNYVVLAEDNAGNRSEAADVPTITEDSTAPVVPAVTYPSATLSTNQSSIEISGTHVEDELSIKLYKDVNQDGVPDDLDTVLGSTTVGSLNTTEWSLEALLSANEINNFVAIAYDKAGNPSPSVLIPTIIADSIAPVITFDALTTGDATPSLTGTIDDPHAEVNVEINGETYSAINNGDGTWTLADDQITTLPHGTYIVTISATDVSGNTNTEPVTNDVEVDLVAPAGHSVNIDQDLIDASNDTALSFTFTNAELDALFNFQISDGTNKVSGNGEIGSGSQRVSNIDVSGLDEGTLTLTILLSDQSGNSSPAVIDSVVKHYNKAPEVGSIIVETEEDVSIKIQPQASDANGDILSFDSVSGPQYGTLTDLNNGWLYTPAENFNGTDHFSYRVNDGEVDSSIAQATINVTPVNDPPVADDDEFTLTQSSAGIYTLDVLENDSDIDGDPIMIEGVNASIGEVSIVDNTVQYEADKDFIGTVRFEYVISDSDKLRSNAIAILNIEGAPAAKAPVITLPEDVEINANALYTKVDLGVATARDFNDQLIPVSLVDGTTYFPPGTHEVYWQATDSNNARTVASQSVSVHPLISLSKDQTVSESQQVTIQFLLNGPSPDYPFEIPYSVSGDALANVDHNAQDGIVVIESGTKAEVTFDILTDDEIEGSETITFSLGDGLNKGSKDQTTITISEDNIAPDVTITVMQSGEQRQSLSKSEGQVQVIARVTEPNSNDELSYEWNADGINIENESEEVQKPENENLNATALKWTFEPAVLTTGVYKITLTATDNGSPSLKTKETLYVEVKETLAVLDDQDTDGDLIPDDEEGYADQDKDGIPDYLDAISDCSVVPEQIDTQNHYLVEGDPGVCLRKGTTSVFSELGGLQLTNEEVETLLGKDDDVENIGGIFDYIAYGLPEKGQTYKMVFPQRLPIPANAVYRKYNETNGWTEFVTDADNKLSSTEGSAGYCPPPGDASWQDGLIEGYWCVQL